MSELSDTLDSTREASDIGTSKEQGAAAVLRGFLYRAFIENAALKLVALFLALTVFVLVHSDENAVYHPSVSVTYSQEKGRVLVSRRVDQVQISVRGTRRRIRRLQKQRLESLLIDTSRLSNTDLILEPSMFNLPEGIELISINPPSIRLEFDERDEKLLTVEVNTIGVPARGFKMGSATISPSKIRVSGARKLLTGLHTITTEKVNLTGRTRAFEGAVALVPGDVEVLDESSVHVSVQIIEELEALELEPKAVVIRGAKGLDVELGGFATTPVTATVTMYGAVHALEAIDAKKVQVIAEMSANDLMQMPRRIELRVEPTLSDIAYKITPSHVTLKTTE